MADELGVIGDQRSDIGTRLGEHDVVGLRLVHLDDDVPREVGIILRGQHGSLLDVGIELADAVDNLAKLLGALLVLGQRQGVFQLLIVDVAPLRLRHEAVEFRNLLGQRVLSTHHLRGEVFHAGILGPDLGGALESSLGLDIVASQGGALGGEQGHVRRVHRVGDLREDRGAWEVTGAAADLIDVAFDIAEVALIPEPLEFAEIPPEGEHLALLLLWVGHHDGLELTEEERLLQALEGAIELPLLHQIIDGLHTFGRILDRLAGKHVEGFQRRYEVGDREELFYFLRSNDDILAATLEEHAVERTRDQRVAIAAGHEERHHLGLELDLRFESEREQFGILGQNLRLRSGLILHLITKLGGSRGRLTERFGLGGPLRTGVIGRLDVICSVDNDAFLHLTQRLHLILGDLNLTELLFDHPNLLDLGGDGEGVVGVDIVFRRLEQKIKGLLLVAVVIVLVDGLGRKQELDLVEERHIALHVAVIGRRGEVALETGADGAGVAEVHRGALPLHGAVLHVHGVAVDVKDTVGATFGGRALVITGRAAAIHRSTGWRRLGETEHSHRTPTKETEERVTHGGKVQKRSRASTTRRSRVTRSLHLKRWPTSKESVEPAGTKMGIRPAGRVGSFSMGFTASTRPRPSTKASCCST